MRRLVAGLTAIAVATGVLLLGPSAAADEIRDREYWLDDYGITRAWEITRGAGVTVAVIDTGVDGSHPDLAGAVVGGADFSGVGSPDGQTPVGNNSEHGTMVASLLAGRGHGDDEGVIGAAPEADVLAVSVGFGVGDMSSDDQIAGAVRWAVDNGADVINVSLTRNTLEWPRSWDEAFLYAMQNDVVVVAAAGNRGSGTTEVGAPATMPGVLVVGGVDRNGKASFDASSQGITISVSAPSEELIGAAPGGGYYAWAGTSGATPIVAGLVALVRAAHPDLDAGNVINRITATARAVSPSVPSPIYGYGLISGYSAVAADVPRVDANPAAQLQEWIRVHRRAAAAPQPVPSGQPSMPAPAPTPVPEAGPQSPLGTLLPTVASVRDVGIPLLVYAILIGAIGWWAWSLRRRVRGPRHR